MNIFQYWAVPRKSITAIVFGVLAGLALHSPVRSQEIPVLPEKASCVPDATHLCLLQSRFRVEVQWQDFSGHTGSGQVVPYGSPDSGLFWFFSANNWEMLVKMVDACTYNQRFWVYSAATTNVAYTLKVTDTVTGQVKLYTNPSGRSSPAVTDSDAFATCSGSVQLPPDPGEAGKLTLAGIDSDHDGIRDDLQRYIALTYSSSTPTMGALRQATIAVQGIVVDSASPSAAIDHASDMARAIECLHAVRPTDAREVYTALLAQALNTESRGLAYMSANDQLAGESFPVQDPDLWASSCASSAFSVLAPVKRPRIAKTASVCGTGDTTIFFGNGMITDFADAEASLDLLTSAVKGFVTPDDAKKISFSLAFNPTGGFLKDFWESVRQDLQTDMSRFWRTLGGIDVMPDSFKNKLYAKAVALDSAAVMDSSVLQRHVNLYKREIFEGKKVLTVVHSQGNFFANQTYNNLSSEEQRSFGIVSVANPDSFVAGNGPYVTLIEDLVIQAIISRKPTPPLPLLPNTTNGVIGNNDLSGHSFIKAYMGDGRNSRGKILSNVQFVRNNLQTPVGSATDGIITITLTWGDQPDIDLHVYEPGGDHVYYANQQGNSGFLDVDDVDGRGPEHYYVACDSLSTGTYQVGVNYYWGDAPETAEIQIKAGLNVRTFQITLPTANGSSGNNSPIFLADIVVSGSAADGYDLQILPR
jgi:hypothetical protein